jgi:hypothetical protein
MIRRASRRTRPHTTMARSRPASKASAEVVRLLALLFVIGPLIGASRLPAAVTAVYWLFFATSMRLCRSGKKVAPAASEPTVATVAAPAPRRISTKRRPTAPGGTSGPTNTHFFLTFDTDNAFRSLL